MMHASANPKYKLKFLLGLHLVKSGFVTLTLVCIDFALKYTAVGDLEIDLSDKA
jgi:hypothetical protein